MLFISESFLDFSSLCISTALADTSSTIDFARSFLGLYSSGGASKGWVCFRGLSRSLGEWSSCLLRLLCSLGTGMEYSAM